MNFIKKHSTYILFFVILFAIAIIEIYKPKPIDWDPTFVNSDKIPYGTFVVYDRLGDIFYDNDVRETFLPIYDEINAAEFDAPVNYMFVARTLSFPEIDEEHLLEFVAEGNNAFISAGSLGSLLDTLDMEFGYGSYYLDADDQDTLKLDTARVGNNFINKNLEKEGGYPLHKNLFNGYISYFDTSTTTILGLDKVGKVNFAKVEFGEGNFFINTTPFAFTNYNMLDFEIAEYSSKLLSHLPVADVIWDEYYKQGRKESTSMFRYFVKNEALRWSLYLTLLSLLLFCIFESKRKQRAIPVVEPLANTSIEYAHSLARLYEGKGDHANLVDKKIRHFHDFIRSKLFIQEIEYSDNFMELLTIKSGVEEEKVKDLMVLINKIQSKTVISERDLIRLNMGIDKFYLDCEMASEID